MRNQTLESDFADPAREVASAVAQFVSGLIAPHETASFASSQNDKDSEETGSNVVEAINGYAWSVGDNPLSFTTPWVSIRVHTPRHCAQKHRRCADRPCFIDVQSRRFHARTHRREIRRHLPSRQKAAKASAYLLNFEPEESCVSIFERSADVVIFRFRARGRRVRESLQGEERGGQISHLCHGSGRPRACREKRKQYLLLSSPSKGTASFYASGRLFRTLSWIGFAVLFFYLRMKQRPTRCARPKRDGRSPARLILYQW